MALKESPLCTDFTFLPSTPQPTANLKSFHRNYSCQGQQAHFSFKIPGYFLVLIIETLFWFFACLIISPLTALFSNQDGPLEPSLYFEILPSGCRWLDQGWPPESNLGKLDSLFLSVFPFLSLSVSPSPPPTFSSSLPLSFLPFFSLPSSLFSLGNWNPSLVWASLLTRQAIPSKPYGDHLPVPL